MKGLEALVCKNCGAPLDKYSLKCEYCGTQYKEHREKGEVHYIQICPAEVKVFGCEVRLTDEMLDLQPEIISKYVTKQMSRNFADALTDYIKLEVHRDPATFTQIVRGTIRVVEPDFRF